MAVAANGSLVRLVDRVVLRVAGEGSRKFLNGLCSQDVLGMRAAASGERPDARPAAFLSPKGRVLCDALLVARSADEVLVDCHHGVAKSLMRLLIRHRLREPLTIEDVSSSHQVIASLPSGASVADDHPVETASLSTDFFKDPRYAGLGHRALLAAEEAAALPAAQVQDLSAYHLWRLCCAVPEGPVDFPVDVVLPLHGNLDLLNFISFTKGCYVGQELTARTKHRGAVRKRFFSVVSVANDDPEGFISGLNLARNAPLPPGQLVAAGGGASAALPGLSCEFNANATASTAPSEAEREVRALRPVPAGEDQSGGDWKPCGVLQSAVGNIGLGLLRCDGQFNHRENFSTQDAFPEGTRLATAGGLSLAYRAPPYAFVE
eukprot:TRINITY_DN30837_c0_g1_i1.p1 TRINITY_DN30837_c0_g1~~TRINITY_DN30837_c0_g1_i1.p1  ORF type:complete len:400 (+),score=46.42 TRINITY_DN30837_c0_g1_i1:72-1202(+)